MYSYRITDVDVILADKIILVESRREEREILGRAILDAHLLPPTSNHILASVLQTIRVTSIMQMCYINRNLYDCI